MRFQIPGTGPCLFQYFFPLPIRTQPKLFEKTFGTPLLAIHMWKLKFQQFIIDNRSLQSTSGQEPCRFFGWYLLKAPPLNKQCFNVACARVFFCQLFPVNAQWIWSQDSSWLGEVSQTIGNSYQQTCGFKIETEVFLIAMYPQRNSLVWRLFLHVCSAEQIGRVFNRTCQRM